MQPAGNTAQITGAARGIGRTIAQADVKDGTGVAITAIDRSVAQTTAQEVGDYRIAANLHVTDKASDALAISVAQTYNVDDGQWIS